MKRKRMMIGIAFFVSLTIGILYYVQSGGKEINEPIPAHVDKMSAKDLVELANTYVEEYWGDRKYYFGKINMIVDEPYSGKVEIWYKDQAQGEEVPNILTVEMDTKKNKIIRIQKQERNSKIEPVAIDQKKWTVDSTEATKISIESLQKEDKELDYKVSSLLLYDRDSKTPIWVISITTTENKKNYTIFLDANSGKVLSKKLLPS